jgi:ribosomal protein S18 acetylase RimI-like enzyme
MTSVQLRPMTSTEYDAWVPAVIAGYAAQHAAAGSMPADSSLELAQQEFEELLPHGPETEEHHVLVAEGDDERVGILWLRVPSSGAAFVYDVEVEPQLRGRGYGRAIMLAAESYARNLGARALRLHVFGSNSVARSLYESLGYHTTNVHMEKRLIPADSAESGP